MNRLIRKNVIAAALILSSACPAHSQILYQPIPSVPASQLPRSYSQRVQSSPVDAALLRNRRSRQYFLDTDDVLGIFIEGVLGNLDESPPIQLPDPTSDLPPSLGYPVAVRTDGTISLPLVDPIAVRGLTIIQVEQLIKSIFRDPNRPILQPENRILVSLMRKRTVSVYVVRGDQSQSSTLPGSALNQSRSGGVNQRSDQSRRSSRLQLPAGDNDLLNALSQTGGLPGVNARSDVKIYRGSRPSPTQGNRPVVSSAIPSAIPSAYGPSSSGWQSASFPRTAVDGTSYPPPSVAGAPWGTRAVPGNVYRQGGNVTTVPTRRPASQPAFIAPVDARLDDGDVVVIEPRDTEVYYTGGLLGGGEFPLPRDRGIDVIEAIAAAGQSVGAARGNNFGVFPQATPTELLILRQRPGQSQLTIRVDVNRAISDPTQRIQVQSGDVLILRHTRGQQLQNAGTGVLNAVGIRQIFGR